MENRKDPYNPKLTEDGKVHTEDYNALISAVTETSYHDLMQLPDVKKGQDHDM